MAILNYLPDFLFLAYSSLRPMRTSLVISREGLPTITVELAAEALGCEPCRIAKTLSFVVNEAPILIVAAGDVKIDNKK